ncbi:MAG: hypothetical protein M0Z54_14625 [Thermaerobacter sp.]|nr:hypothetical protein [Thermaerobacter sp.]
MAGLPLAAVAGCGGPASAPPPGRWYYVFELTVLGQRYRVTHHTVGRLGRRVAVVSYQGVESGVYTIFSVSGVPVSQEVAVDACQGYLKALRVHSPAG